MNRVVVCARWLALSVQRPRGVSGWSRRKSGRGRGRAAGRVPDRDGAEKRLSPETCRQPSQRSRVWPHRRPRYELGRTAVYDVCLICVRSRCVTTRGWRAADTHTVDMYETVRPGHRDSRECRVRGSRRIDRASRRARARHSHTDIQSSVSCLRTEISRYKSSLELYCRNSYLINRDSKAPRRVTRRVMRRVTQRM